MKRNKFFIQPLITAVTLLFLFQYVNGQPGIDIITDRDGNTYTMKLMPDKKQWLTKNLNINIESSWCYENNPSNCQEYGRLYTFQSAVKACEVLGEEWRLPTNGEWEVLASHYGGVRDKSLDGGKAAFKAMMTGGDSGINWYWEGIVKWMGTLFLVLEPMDFIGHPQRHRMLPPGSTISEPMGIVNRHKDGEKLSAVAVRCVRDLER